MMLTGGVRCCATSIRLLMEETGLPVIVAEDPLTSLSAAAASRWSAGQARHGVREGEAGLAAEVSLETAPLSVECFLFERSVLGPALSRRGEGDCAAKRPSASC